MTRTRKQRVPSLLIRGEATADRGVRAVTTREVLTVVKAMQSDTFSTHEVVNAVREAFSSHAGIDFARLEYSVRQSVSWLVRRGKLRVTAKTLTRYTSDTHEKYFPKIYMLDAQEWRTDPVEPEPCDVQMLNRIFFGV